MVLGLIGVGAGCYYLFILPYAQRNVPSAPAAALPPAPTIPAAPTPLAVDAGTARKEVERQEAARKEGARLAAQLKADLAERDKLDAIIKEEEAKKEYRQYLIGRLSQDERTMAVAISRRFADPQCKTLSSGVVTDADKVWMARFGFAQ